MFGGGLGTGRSDAFVHIVESPSSAQLFDGVMSGRLLTAALRIGGIKNWHRIASDLDFLELSLGKDLIDAIRHHQALPVLHLNIPVSGEGVKLTDGTLLSLGELSARLTPLNQALGAELIVCMPECRGTAAARMATSNQEEPPPYYALVGSHEEVPAGKTALGFAAFYQRLFNGASIADAVEALKSASGTLSFYVQYSSEIRTALGPKPTEKGSSVRRCSPSGSSTEPSV